MTVACVVLNLGLKSIRAIAFTESGAKVATAARPVQTMIRDEWVEQDPEEWWTLGVDCLQEVTQRIANQPAFVTVTASSACLVPIDSTGRALRRAIMVSDRRSMPQARSIGLLAEFREIAAHNSAFTPDPYFQLPKALWIKEHEPEVWSRTVKLLTPADFLANRLSGVIATDALNAEKYYFSRGSYPSSLLARIDIHESFLPDVLPIGATLGAVTGPASNATGLSTSVRVVQSTYDAICAFWGSGVSAVGDVADVSGTVTSVRVLMDRDLAPGESRVFSQQMDGTPLRVAGGSNNLGGGLIEWLKQSFYPGDELAYERLEREAAASEPTARGLVFLPYLLGERCPVWDIDARGVLFGLERHHSRGDVARAVLESSAFSVMHILRTLSEHGATFSRLRVSGGLARISLVNQLKADVSGIPVEVVAEFETTALGAFILAGTGTGHFSSIADGARLSRVREVIVPDTSRTAMYAEWFEVFLETYTALRPLFARRASYKHRHFSDSVDRLENL